MVGNGKAPVFALEARARACGTRWTISRTAKTEGTFWVLKVKIGYRNEIDFRDSGRDGDVAAFHFSKLKFNSLFSGYELF